jgi:hypothetical protein
MFDVVGTCRNFGRYVYKGKLKETQKEYAKVKDSGDPVREYLPTCSLSKKPQQHRLKRYNTVGSLSNS